MGSVCVFMHHEDYNTLFNSKVRTFLLALTASKGCLRVDLFLSLRLKLVVRVTASVGVAVGQSVVLLRIRIMVRRDSSQMCVPDFPFFLYFCGC